MRASVYLLFGLLSVSTVFAQPLSVVSPSGLEDTDGNYSYVPENRPYPATLPVHTPNGWRGQGLHVSAAFESLGPGPFEITGLAWRPDISVNAPVTAEWQMTVLMSTTAREAESLSSTFADNYGADGVTQVFSGSAQFQTDGVPRGDGLPHEFDYVVEFDTPYVYDPQKGNLLLDMASPTDIGSGFLWTDGDLRTVAHVLALSEGAQTGVPGPGEFVTKFMIDSEPSTGDFNMDGELDVEDIDSLSASVCSGLHWEPFDLNGDESVDRTDVGIWVHDLKNTSFGDADLNGEFNSSDMVQVFAAGKYETGEEAGWGEGDWDGSCVFDNSDMVAAFADGGYEKGRRTDAVAVPEPASVILLLGSLIFIATHRRRLDP